MRLHGGPAWQISCVLTSLITTAQKDVVRDSTQGSTDQRPNDRHGLAGEPRHRIRPLLPTVFASPSIPPSPVEAVWGLQLCGRGHPWGQQHIWAACPTCSPPRLSELGVRGWHVYTASPGQGEAGGWGCACSLTEAAYHAVLTCTEAGTCVPCTDRWED